MLISILYVILMIKYHVVGLLNVIGVIKCYVDINIYMHGGVAQLLHQHQIEE